VENHPEWTLEYGLRYEFYTPISERAHRTSSFLNSFPPAGVGQEYLINPQPTYQNRLERLGAACSGGLERAPRGACAHGRGDHSDSDQYLAGQSSDRVNALRCLFRASNASTKRGDFLRIQITSTSGHRSQHSEWMSLGHPVESETTPVTVNVRSSGRPGVTRY